jgi:hypothetical protein
VSCCADCAGQWSLPCAKLHKRGVVTSRGATQLRVHFDGEDQTVSIRPHLMWVRPRLLSIEQVIERIEDLRNLIPEPVTGDG